jgi:hypothetical protein
VSEGQSETFTVQASDPDTLDNLTVFADWTGSGTFEQVDPSEMTANSDGSLSFTHEYDDTPTSGTTDNAVIEVVDDGGQTSTSTLPVTITSTPASGTLGPASLLFNNWTLDRLTSYVDPSGNPMYAIAPGTPFVFTGVSDPSPADSGGLTYHWTVTVNPQLAGATTTTETTTDPQFELPGADYVNGSVLQVSGWISYTNANQQVIASAPQTVYTFVVPANMGINETRLLHGTVLPDEMATPPEYDPYLAGTDGYTGAAVQSAIGANQPIVIRFQMDPVSRTQGSAAAPLQYIAQVTVTNTNTGSVQTFTVTSSDPTLTLGSFPSDRQIAITAIAVTTTRWGLPFRSPGYGITLVTPQTQSIWQQAAGTIDNVVNALGLIQSLATQFGDTGTAVVNAIGTNPSGFFNNLTTGLVGAVGSFIQGLPNEILNAGITWLGLPNVPNIPNLNDSNAITSFLLQYAGLTWSNVQSILVQALGSNAAAVNTVVSWISKYNTSDPSTLLTFLESGEIPGLNMQTLNKQMAKAFDAILTQAATSAVQSLVAKFAPGGGVVSALYQGFTWVLNNQNTLSTVIGRFLNSLNQLATDPGGFQNTLVDAMNKSIPALIGLAASQLGLGNLPTTIQKALQFVPAQVNQKLTAAVQALVKQLPLSGGGNGTNALYAGLLSPVVPFTFRGTQYQMWVAKDAGKGVVKIAKVVSGRPQFLKVLTAADFDSSAVTTAATDISTLISAAGAMATASTLPKSPAKPQPSQLTAMQTASQALPPAEQQVIKDTLANACIALNAGCFAAGTKLWTPDGYRAVEELRPGDRVWARSEFDPNGPIEAKEVEARFMRTGRILHLHFPDGELIRTTPEHPFFVEGKDWTPAGLLKEGDRIATLSGEWVPISEVFDTEEWEPVYNLRVADYHTYFVGDEHWGFAAWAHNAYEFISGRRVAELVDTATGSKLLTAAAKAKILEVTLDEGAKHGRRYGAVADQEELVFRLSQALRGGDPRQNQAAVVERVMTSYFAQPGVQENRDRLEMAVQNMSDWKKYIQTKLNDFDARDRTLAEYEAQMNAAGIDPNTHGHHIVFKLGAAGGTVIDEARDSRDILLYYGINPYWDRANLAYAPNDGHSQASLLYMRTELGIAFQRHDSKQQIIDLVRSFADRYIDGTLPGR